VWIYYSFQNRFDILFVWIFWLGLGLGLGLGLVLLLWAEMVLGLISS
jgi:hypothetical protein